MRRVLCSLLVATSLLLAGILAWAWYDAATKYNSIGFFRHKQKWEIASTTWQLRIDNEPQRQMESDAPRVQAYQLVDRLDELFNKERPFLRVPADRRDMSATSALNLFGVQERNVILQLSALGYVPRIARSIHGWGGEFVDRVNGKPVFSISPLAPPAPTTLPQSIAIPFPLLLALPLLLPARAATRQLRRLARGLRMQCLTCGYDLRASIDRCPECGTPISFHETWTRRLERTQYITHRIARFIGKAWVFFTPRTERLQERWILYVMAWLAIIEFPIVLFDIVAEVFHPNTNWTRVGASTIRMLLDLCVAAGSVHLTRGVPRDAGPVG